MDDERTYYLNGIWKWQLLVVGIVGLGAWIIAIYFLIWVDHQSVLSESVLVLFVVALLPLELIYEGLRSRVVISNEVIEYFQPRFHLVCRWEDITGLLPLQPGLTFVFSKSEILSGKPIAWSLTLLGPWTRSIPIGAYLTPASIDHLRRVAWPHIQKLNLSEIEFANLSRMFGKPKA